MKIHFSLLLACFLPFAVAANEWPTWRGPAGDGQLPESASYPVEWSADSNLLWKTDLPAPGNSSAVVAKGRVFLTMAESTGKTRSLLCFDAKSGSLLWKKSVEYGEEDPTHKTNPFCAASPVVDGELVFAWHGNGGLWAYDLEGNEKWHRDLGTGYRHQWGANAASPVIYRGGLIVHAGPGMTVQLFGLNKETGETVWKQDLPEALSNDIKEFKGSWATPLLIENEGRSEMLIGLPGSLRSFDPKDGSEHWRIGGLSDLCYTNALEGNGHVVYLCGFGGPGIGARLPGAGDRGDLTESHRLWADPPKGKNQNPQRIGSGQIIGDHLYLLNEPGVIQCLEVKTGKSLWRERLSQRKSWSSMNYVGGKLYVNDTAATTYVIGPDASGLKLISTNPLGERLHTNASPAFADGRIYLRTDTALFAIGELRIRIARYVPPRSRWWGQRFSGCVLPGCGRGRCG